MRLDGSCWQRSRPYEVKAKPKRRDSKRRAGERVPTAHPIWLAIRPISAPLRQLAAGNFQCWHFVSAPCGGFVPINYGWMNPFEIGMTLLRRCQFVIAAEQHLNINYSYYLRPLIECCANCATFGLNLSSLLLQILLSALFKTGT